MATTLATCQFEKGRDATGKEIDPIPDFEMAPMAIVR